VERSIHGTSLRPSYYLAISKIRVIFEKLIVPKLLKVLNIKFNCRFRNSPPLDTPLRLMHATTNFFKMHFNISLSANFRVSFDFSDSNLMKFIRI
jgi:hypothetical protein